MALIKRAGQSRDWLFSVKKYVSIVRRELLDIRPAPVSISISNANPQNVLKVHHSQFLS